MPANPIPTNPELRRMLVMLGPMLAVLLLGGWLVTWEWAGTLLREGHAADSSIVGRDFLNFWLMGRAALTHTPGILYDIATYNTHLRAFVGDNDYLVQQLSYPPSLLLPLAPLGLLPYLTALAAFWLVGLAVLIGTLRRIGWAHRDMLLLLASPAAVATLISGQWAFVATAALLGGFALLPRQPLLAGLLFGLLSLKPHFALLLPLALLAGRHWRAFAVATATTLLLAAMPALLYGPGVWLAFLEQGLPAQHFILEAPAKNIRAWMPTLFMDARTVGLDYRHAMLAQLPGLLAGSAAVLWAYAKRRDAAWAFLLFTACCLLATPYAMAYDTLAFTAALLMVLARHRWPGGRILAAALYLLPVVHFIATAFELPGTALLPVAAMIMAIRELRKA